MAISPCGAEINQYIKSLQTKCSKASRRHLSPCGRIRLSGLRPVFLHLMMGSACVDNSRFGAWSRSQGDSASEHAFDCTYSLPPGGGQVTSQQPIHVLEDRANVPADYHWPGVNPAGADDSVEATPPVMRLGQGSTNSAQSQWPRAFCVLVSHTRVVRSTLPGARRAVLVLARMRTRRALGGRHQDPNSLSPTSCATSIDEGVSRE
jgi:hypothetical protein